MEWMEISVEFVAAKTGIREQNLIIFKLLPSGFCAGTKPDPNHSVVKIEPKETHEDAALITILTRVGLQNLLILVIGFIFFLHSKLDHSYFLRPSSPPVWVEMFTPDTRENVWYSNKSGGCDVFLLCSRSSRFRRITQVCFYIKILPTAA